MWGGGEGGEDGGMRGAGDRGGGGDLFTHTELKILLPHVPKSPLQHTIPEILEKSLYYCRSR
jgi:hypothetical protein